jgi:hypothetical protein
MLRTITKLKDARIGFGFAAVASGVVDSGAPPHHSLPSSATTMRIKLPKGKSTHVYRAGGQDAVLAQRLQQRLAARARNAGIGTAPRQHRPIAGLMIGPGVRELIRQVDHPWHSFASPTDDSARSVEVLRNIGCESATQGSRPYAEELRERTDRGAAAAGEPTQSSLVRREQSGTAAGDGGKTWAGESFSVQEVVKELREAALAPQSTDGVSNGTGTSNESQVGASATAAPAQARPEPMFRSPALGVDKSSGHKQYMLGDLPVFAAYSQAQADADPEIAPKAFVGAGELCVVRRRDNTAASVLVKRTHEPVEDMKPVREQCTTLNELAALLAQADAAPMKDHFAPEVLKEVDAQGRVVYYTPFVEGIGPDRWLREPGRYADELSPAQLREALAALKGAMRWLSSKGFVHGDATPGNIVFDPRRGKLVLIDFGSAAKTSGEAGLRHDLDVLDMTVSSRLS